LNIISDYGNVTLTKTNNLKTKVMKKSIQLFVSCSINHVVQAQWSSKSKINGNGNVVSEKEHLRMMKLL
jgi:hypothetical protein